MEYNSFPIQCFGPGFPPGGAKGQGIFKEDHLTLAGDEQSWTLFVPLISIEISPGGFDHQQIILLWKDEDKEFSAFITTPSGRQIFIQEAPQIIRGKLNYWIKKTTRTTRRFRLMIWGIGIVLLIPFFLAAILWWQKDHIVDWVVDKVPIETERNLGEISWKMFYQTNPPVYNDSSLSKTITEIGDRLTKGSRYRYQWYIINDNSINAFALPGGYVVIHSGLIKAADTPEELAGVLAHEVQHVEQRHSLRAIIYTLGWKAMFNMMIGDIFTGVWGDLAAKLGQLQFSRDQETAADEKGLEALIKAEINPEGMISFFEKLSKKEGAAISLLSTHPAGIERLKHLKGLISQQNKAFSVLHYDWKTDREVIKD